MQTTEVDWHTYAQKYDMLLAYNPFYQELHRQVMEEVYALEVQAGDLLIDVGAGTGNYSIEIARAFPKAEVIHLDSNPGMNKLAAKKQMEANLHNHQILHKPVGEAIILPETVRAIVSIHALYAIPEPKTVLQRFYDWLEPGGHAILVDAGRMLNMWDWQLAIGWHLLRKYGLQQSLKILREGKIVSRQNQYIRQMQRNGTFWTHSHAEFCAAVTDSGFSLIHSSTTFRGYSDLVLAYKSV